MTDRAADNNHPWKLIEAFFTSRLTLLTIMANLAGACIVTSYFMFFDPNIKIQRITKDLIVIGIMFVGLVVIATVFLARWQKDLMRFVELKSRNQPVESKLNQRVQQKILNLPYVCSMTSGFNWVLASIIMTVYFSVLPGGDLSTGLLGAGIRTFTGVIIAGVVTCAIVFSTIEIHSRKFLP